MRHIDENGEFQAPWICFLGSSPAGSTTTTQNSAPWSGQQPYISNIYAQAQNLNQTPGPQYYPSDTYAGLTPQQNGIMSQMINYGTGGGTTGLQSANQNLTSTLSPGYTSQTGGTFNQGNNVLSNETSSGYLNPWNSPSFGTVVNNTLASTIPATSASFINGGRSDSGLAQRAQTMAATDAVGNLAQSQYNTNQNIQNSAASQASNNYLTQQGNQIKGAAIAPMVDQATAGNLGTALQTAGMTQANNQNQTNANVAAYNYGQMLPYNKLGMFENSIAGMGNPGGSVTSSQPYFSNTLGNVLGAGTGLLGLNAMTGAAGGGFGSTMLGSLFALSDRRLKKDIEKIGVSDSGFPLYTFRYKDEGPMSMHIGVMAQDVEKRRPDAIVETPIGKAVNYTKALAV